VSLTKKEAIATVMASYLLICSCNIDEQTAIENLLAT
jgi:hypothetical protein